MTHSPEPWRTGEWRLKQESCGGKSPRKRQWEFCQDSGMVHSGAEYGAVVESVDPPKTGVFGADWTYDEYTPPSCEDLLRIVACVNFCRHLSAEWMEGKVVPTLPADAESLASLSGMIGLIPVCKEKP
jgi:hypothetical protein